MTLPCGAGLSAINADFVFVSLVYPNMTENTVMVVLNAADVHLGILEVR